MSTETIDVARVALVTGGGRGIGRACVQRLAADGIHVVIADRAPAGELVKELRGGGYRAHEEPCDLSQPHEIEHLLANVLERFGRCDILVNNAALQPWRALAELDLQLWREIQAINVEAPLLLSAGLVPHMIEHGFGRIVNIISNTVWNPPNLGMIGYVASKGALLGMTRALAVEIGHTGITVNAVAPGLTPTPATEASIPREVFDIVLREQAIKTQLSPSDTASVVGFLASDAAALITGQALRVDGGLVTL